jgi:hypothetical protein
MCTARQSPGSPLRRDTDRPTHSGRSDRSRRRRTIASQECDHEVAMSAVTAIHETSNEIGGEIAGPAAPSGQRESRRRGARADTNAGLGTVDDVRLASRQRCASPCPRRSGVVIGDTGCPPGRDCGSRRCACCRPNLRRPASAPGSRSRGRAATLVDANLAPGPDEQRCCCGALGDRCTPAAERRAGHWYEPLVDELRQPRVGGSILAGRWLVTVDRDLASGRRSSPAWRRRHDECARPIRRAIALALYGRERDDRGPGGRYRLSVGHKLCAARASPGLRSRIPVRERYSDRSSRGGPFAVAGAVGLESSRPVLAEDGDHAPTDANRVRSLPPNRLAEKSNE